MCPSPGRHDVISAVTLSGISAQRMRDAGRGPLLAEMGIPRAMPGPFSMCIDRLPQSVFVVRRTCNWWLRYTCQMRPERIDTVLTVVSELVTNAVRHNPGGGPTIGFTGFSERPGRIELRVDDSPAPELPEPKQADDDAECGRGLFLVNAFVAELKGEWGFADNGAAWCRLPIHD